MARPVAVPEWQRATGADAALIEWFLGILSLNLGLAEECGLRLRPDDRLEEIAPWIDALAADEIDRALHAKRPLLPEFTYTEKDSLLTIFTQAFPND